MDQDNLNGFTWELAKDYQDVLSTVIPNYIELNHIVLGMLSNYVDQDEEAVVYDLGAGPGVLMQIMLGKYPKLRYYAVDLYLPMIDSLNTKLDAVRKVQDLPYARVQTWDLNNNRDAGHDFVSMIIANYIFSYLIPTSRLFILKNSYQELKPGGCMVICDIVGLDSVSKMKPNEMLQPQTVEQTITLLKEAGFEENKIEVFFRLGDFAGILARK